MVSLSFEKGILEGAGISAPIEKISVEIRRWNTEYECLLRFYPKASEFHSLSLEELEIERRIREIIRGKTFEMVLVNGGAEKKLILRASLNEALFKSSVEDNYTIYLNDWTMEYGGQ